MTKPIESPGPTGLAALRSALSAALIEREAEIEAMPVDPQHASPEAKRRATSVREADPQAEVTPARAPWCIYTPRRIAGFTSPQRR
jgi:hypothetical protein